MGTFVAPPWVEAARRGDAWAVWVDQTTAFASADGNGFYEFTDGPSGVLAYTVPSNRKAALSWFVAENLTNTTTTARAAWYRNGTITGLRLPILPHNANVPNPIDLTSILTVGTSSGTAVGLYVAADVIKLKFLPSSLTDDWFVAFGGWLE